MMTNCDPNGRIFLSYLHTNNGLFFLLNTAFIFQNKLPEVPEYTKMQLHMMTSLNITMASLDDHVRAFKIGTTTNVYT